MSGVPITFSIVRISTAARRRPPAMPGITSFTISDSMSRNTRRRVDPSAIRRASSRCRVATMNPTTPTMPSAASTSTRPPATATAVDSAIKSPWLFSTKSCPVTMPGNATPGNASTPNSRSAFSRAAFSCGSSPGAPRAMRCTVGATASTFAKASVDKSGSGSRICGRAVVSCDVAKSALTPTIVNSCSRLSSSATVTRSPIGSVPGNSCSASGSEMTATGAAMRRSSAVIVRPR